MTKYNIDKDKFIDYEKLDDFILVRYLFTNDSSSLDSQVKHYFDYLKDLKIANFLAIYPGTLVPIIIPLLNLIHSYNLNYRLYYNEQEVIDKVNFENTVLKDFFNQMSSTLTEYKDTQSACHGSMGTFCKEQDFKLCGIVSSFYPEIEKVSSPVRFYKINDDGYLIAEYDEDPNDGGNYWKSMRLKDSFANKLIRVENGKLKYYPK